MRDKIPFSVILIDIHAELLKTMKRLEIIQFKPEVQPGWQSSAVQMWCETQLGHLSRHPTNESKDLLHSIDHASGQADSLPMLWAKERKEMTKGTNHGNYVFKKRFQKHLYTKMMQIFLMWAWFIYHNCIVH